MKPMQRGEHNWKGMTPEQVVDSFQAMAENVGHPITREQAQRLYDDVRSMWRLSPYHSHQLSRAAQKNVVC